MKKRNFLLSVAMLFLVLFIVACGGDEEEADGGDTSDDNDGDTAEQDEAPEFLSILTGGTGGTYYPLGGEIAQIITDETGIDVTALSSNASADNIVDVQEDEAEIAMVQTDVMSDAAEGINAFEGEQVDNVLGLG